VVVGKLINPLKHLDREAERLDIISSGSKFAIQHEQLIF
jgi:hypothetical protein